MRILDRSLRDFFGIGPVSGLTGVAGESDHVIDRRIAGSPDRRIAGSPDRRIAGSPDRRIAGHECVRRMAAPVSASRLPA